MPQPLSNRFCPMHMQACPIPGATGLTGEFECLDTMNELESCGGCASIGEGQDCSAIKGAWNVGCEQGRCAGKLIISFRLTIKFTFFVSLHLHRWLSTCPWWKILHCTLKYPSRPFGVSKANPHDSYLL